MRTSLLLLLFVTHMALGQSKITMVDGKKMASKSFGLETRKPGAPVLVFESGMGSGGGAYEIMLPAIAQKTAGIMYDRNGLGGSEPDTTIKSDADVARRLHSLLKTLHVQPPYILIGHSLGGPLIRMFSAIYPNEVGGMMFIDPSDFMLTEKEDEEVKVLSGSAMGFRQMVATMLEKFSKDTANNAGTRNEMQRVRNNAWYFGEYVSLPPLPDVPVVVMISYNRHIERDEEELSRELNVNAKGLFKEMNRFRIDHFADMIKNNHKSAMILLPGYSHGIHHQDPGLASNVLLELYNKVVLIR